MKKSLIAGAGIAALGLAVVPFAGVFAADPTPVNIADTITLTVAQGCEFSAGGSSVNPNATSVATGGTADFGGNTKHEFTIKCNTKSYQVEAVATDLINTSATSHGEIGYVANATYGEGVTNPGVDGQWTAVLTGGKTDAAISKTKSTIKAGNSTDTDNFSVEYKAYAGTAQNQGTYTGTVTYTLTGSNS